MCSIDGRGDLKKDTFAGFRVEEADHTGEASSRLLIDELDAFLLERVEFGVHVGSLEADVVEALALALQETADGGVGASRFEQLDLALADGEERRSHALVFDGVLSMDVEAEGIAVEVKSIVEGVDGDADVVDLLDHEVVPRASTVPKTDRRDSSRFERKSATAPMVVARQVGFWPHGLKMTRFICALAFAKRRSCPRGWFHDRRRWGQAPRRSAGRGGLRDNWLQPGGAFRGRNRGLRGPATREGAAGWRRTARSCARGRPRRGPGG